MKLRAWRKSNGWEYQQLAEAIGVSRSFAHKIEIGLHFPKAETILRIEMVSEGRVTSDDLLQAWKERRAA